MESFNPRTQLLTTGVNHITCIHIKITTYRNNMVFFFLFFIFISQVSRWSLNKLAGIHTLCVILIYCSGRFQTQCAVMVWKVNLRIGYIFKKKKKSPCHRRDHFYVCPIQLNSLGLYQSHLNYPLYSPRSRRVNDKKKKK